MADKTTPRGLYSLPTELKRIIFLDVLQQGRKKEPTFTRAFIQNRIRLRNCFDGTYTELTKSDTTNIYVPKHRYLKIHGHALLATNRQLRREIQALIEDELKSGKINVPFVLDVMFVKDIGVFPTWMSFPYKPRRLERLELIHVNVRIIRQGAAAAFPNQWIEAARYPTDNPYRQYGLSPATWNLFMVLTLYAMGRFSAKPVTTNIKHLSQINPPKAPHKQEKNSEIVDAYFLPIAPYTTDKLHVDFKPFEHLPNGSPIESKMEDDARKSIHFREGSTQFSREIFGLEPDPRDNRVRFSIGGRTRRMTEDLIREGRLGSAQLVDRLVRAVSAVHYAQDHGYGVGIDVLADSIGKMVHCESDCIEVDLVDMHTTYMYDFGYWNAGSYDLSAVDFKAAQAWAVKENDMYLKNGLRILKTRLRRGWDRYID